LNPPLEIREVRIRGLDSARRSSRLRVRCQAQCRILMITFFAMLRLNPNLLQGREDSSPRSSVRNDRPARRKKVLSPIRVTWQGRNQDHTDPTKFVPLVPRYVSRSLSDPIPANLPRSGESRSSSERDLSGTTSCEPVSAHGTARWSTRHEPAWTCGNGRRSEARQGAMAIFSRRNATHRIATETHANQPPPTPDARSVEPSSPRRSTRALSDLVRSASYQKRLDSTEKKISIEIAARAAGVEVGLVLQIAHQV